ncbi:MAG: DEAD/DEAH box helicase [Candidatus Levybacteria bacterium]|nr:DEAD/DEAH box helicase [Candidatus Levybacteria bacterium]
MDKRRFTHPGGNPRKNNGRGFNRGFRKFPQRTMPKAELIAAIATTKALNEIKQTQPDAEYIPTNKFEDFKISPLVLENIKLKGYTTPTPIQDRIMHSIIEGRDVIGIANTGTGKTAAFLIPLADKVFRNKLERVLIVAPTHELVLQIHDELRGFARGLGIYTALCIGGVSMGKQISQLRQKPHFVIGTPGRLKDIIETRILNLSEFHNVVLDEADRMVDIGFIKDIKYFISLMPQVRQSLFFSATISGKVKEILQNFVRNPITVSVKKQETAEGIEQEIIRVAPGQNKVDKLHDLLRQPGFEKVLIFGRTKWGVQKLTEELIRRGFKAGAIHGNKRQNQRQKTLEAFKSNEINILLGTDVASRGLDIPDVSHVINYDMPESYEVYVHRIGRTGRADKKGIALTFIEQ